MGGIRSRCRFSRFEGIRRHHDIVHAEGGGLRYVSLAWAWIGRITVKIKSCCDPRVKPSIAPVDEDSNEWTGKNFYQVLIHR